MIRDATGINEVVDGSTPKGDALVGVREQAISAANNALYDITNASMVLYRKVCADIVRCLQVIPPDSILYRTYVNSIGETNMSVLSSFKNLSMYNFGIKVVSELNDSDRQYLEQNIQIALSQKEIDLEDAIAIRQLRDVEQAERLLVVRRKKRIKAMQEQAQQQAQMTAQVNAQQAEISGQVEMQKKQFEAQLEAQKLELETQSKMQLMELQYTFDMQLLQAKGEFDVAEQRIESGVRQQNDTVKEDRKDERIELSAIEQSKLISQRKGESGPITSGEEDSLVDLMLNQ